MPPESFQYVHRNKDGQDITSVYTIGPNGQGIVRTKEQVIKDWKHKLASGQFNGGDYVVVSADDEEFDLTEWFRRKMENLYGQIDALESEMERRGIEL